MKNAWIAIVCVLTRIGFSQKRYSISGQVISSLSGFSLTYYHNVRLRIEGDSTKTTCINRKGEFKIKRFQSGNYKLIIDFSNESGEFWFARYDTVITINKKSLENIIISVPCTYCDCFGIGKKKALGDIEKGKPQIYLFGFGIDGMMRPQPNDERFQKKYGVSYVGFGCSGPDDECLGAYNSATFEYLDKKFGEKWRKEARTDAISLEK